MTEQHSNPSKLETTLSIATGLVGVGLTGLCLYEPSLKSYVGVVGLASGLAAGVVARYTKNPQKFLRNALFVALIGSTIIYHKYTSHERNHNPIAIETPAKVNKL